MQRDLICVVGNQGFGKSVWTKAYSAQSKRLLVSDPMASFPNVDFTREISDWMPELLEDGDGKEFRFGVYEAEDLPIIGSGAYAIGDCTLVIEEAALVFPRGADLDKWAKRLVFMGRHARVNLVLVAQRAVKIPLDVRSQATRIITFRQTEPDDVSALCDRIGKEHYETISTLPELKCLDWQNNAVQSYMVRP